MVHHVIRLFAVAQSPKNDNIINQLVPKILLVLAQEVFNVFAMGSACKQSPSFRRLCREFLPWPKLQRVRRIHSNDLFDLNLCARVVVDVTYRRIEFFPALHRPPCVPLPKSRSRRPTNYANPGLVSTWGLFGIDFVRSRRL